MLDHTRRHFITLVGGAASGGAHRVHVGDCVNLDIESVERLGTSARPNFVLLDSANEEIARLVTAMLRARDAVERVAPRRAGHRGVVRARWPTPAATAWCDRSAFAGYPLPSDRSGPLGVNTLVT
jgi:hypothetical protein